MTKRKNKKLLLLLVLVLLLCGAAYFVTSRHKTLNSEEVSGELTDGVNLEPPTQEELDRNDKEKVRKIENPTTSSAPEGSSKVKIQDAYFDTASSEVVVKTELYGTSWQTCKLTLKKDGLLISREAPVVYQQPYSICGGFSVKDPILSSGQWQAELEAVKMDGSSEKSEVKIVDVRQ